MKYSSTIAQDSSEMVFPQDKNVVKALTPDRPKIAFADRVGTSCRMHPMRTATIDLFE